MSVPRVTERKILAVLRSKYGGILRRAGSDDIVLKLMHELHARTAQRKVVLDCVDRLVETGKLTVERDEGTYILIAVPKVLAEQQAAASTTRKEDDMPPGRRTGTRRTTSPQRADGSPLPSMLPDELVGPLQISNVDPKAEQASIAATELVYDQLVRNGRERLHRRDIDVVIQAVLADIYPNMPEVVSTYVPMVMGMLTGRKYIANESGPTRSRTCMYLVRPPEVQPDVEIDVLQAIVQLLERMDELMEECWARQEELGGL